MENNNLFKFVLNPQFFADEDTTNPKADEEEGSDQVDDSEVNEGEENETDETDDQEEEEPAAKDGKDGDSKQRNRSKDAEFAARRREAEKAAKEKAEKENQDKERKKAYLEGKIAGLGGTNKFLEKPISSEFDLHVYEIMLEAEAKGENPYQAVAVAMVDENASKRQKAEEEEKAKLDKEKEEAELSAKRKELAEKNMKELHEKYSACSREWFQKAYSENADFKELLDKGIHPIKAVEILKIVPKETQRGTPGSGGRGVNSKSDVATMTKAQFDSYWKEKYGS